TVEYLGSFIPKTAGPCLQVPANAARDDLLRAGTEGGGDGERRRVREDGRLMGEAWRPDPATASARCRDLHGLIRSWRDRDESKTVTFLRTTQRPTFMPDEATRTPGYFTLVDLTFRADRREIQQKSDS